MIQREFIKVLQAKLHKGKVIILVGPRQVGKTTLINTLLKDKAFLFLDGDDHSVAEILSNANTETLRSIIGDHKYIFVDEAQRIPNIGLKLKIIVDQIKGVQVIVSGSSAFDINNETQEPLTGRKFEYHLFPISWNEFEKNVGYIKAQQQLELRLLYGMYPDVINNFGNEYEVLKNLTSSYLYKDILALTNIRKPEVLEKIVQALAFQVGSEVSYNEIAQLVGVDKNTVNDYIDLLVNAFELRQDKGALWENFMISERQKVLNFQQSPAKPYFWRTTAQQEIDYVEAEADHIKAFEFKWSEKKKTKLPKSFVETYNPDFMVVTKNNFRDFLK